MGVGTAIDGASAELLCGQPKLGSLGSALSGDGGMMEGGIGSATVVCLEETVVVVVGTIGVGCINVRLKVVVHLRWGCPKSLCSLLQISVEADKAVV